MVIGPATAVPEPPLASSSPRIVSSRRAGERIAVGERPRQRARERAGLGVGDAQLGEAELACPGEIADRASDGLARGAEAEIAGEPAGEGRRAERGLEGTFSTAPSPTKEASEPWRVMVSAPFRRACGEIRGEVADRDPSGVIAKVKAPFAPRSRGRTRSPSPRTATCPPWMSRPLCPKRAVDQRSRADRARALSASAATTRAARAGPPRSVPRDVGARAGGEARLTAPLGDPSAERKERAVALAAERHAQLERHRRHRRRRRRRGARGTASRRRAAASTSPLVDDIVAGGERERAGWCGRGRRRPRPPRSR